jgi:hypothetical protein
MTLTLQDTPAQAAPVRLSDSITNLLIESLTVDQVRHICDEMARREHVPNRVAKELAEELATIFSKPPLEVDGITVHNRPTLGWFRRRAARIAEARSS